MVLICWFYFYWILLDGDFCEEWGFEVPEMGILKKYFLLDFFFGFLCKFYHENIQNIRLHVSWAPGMDFYVAYTCLM